MNPYKESLYTDIRIFRRDLAPLRRPMERRRRPLATQHGAALRGDSGAPRRRAALLVHAGDRS